MQTLKEIWLAWKKPVKVVAGHWRHSEMPEWFMLCGIAPRPQEQGYGYVPGGIGVGYDSHQAIWKVYEKQTTAEDLFTDLADTHEWAGMEFE